MEGGGVGRGRREGVERGGVGRGRREGVEGGAILPLGLDEIC